ncbi:MAG: hypothetical protein LBQ49_01665 [Rickettsiales bacterium]|nr:hypothetical protein [Rickettsiales bacterium]
MQKVIRFFFCCGVGCAGPKGAGFEVLGLRLNLFASKIKHQIHFNNTETLLRMLDGRPLNPASTGEKNMHELRKCLISQEQTSKERVDTIMRRLQKNYQIAGSK